MIWFYLAQFFRFLRRMVMPPSPRDVARIDPHSPCPVCGGRSGKLRCVDRSAIGAGIRALRVCGNCGARWHETPIVKVTRDQTWPAIPASDQESREMCSAPAAMNANMNDVGSKPS